MTIHIRRREFIFTLGGAAAAWPLAARAQQGERMRRIMQIDLREYVKLSVISTVVWTVCEVTVGLFFLMLGQRLWEYYKYPVAFGFTSPIVWALAFLLIPPAFLACLFLERKFALGVWPAWALRTFLCCTLGTSIELIASAIYLSAFGSPLYLYTYLPTFGGWGSWLSPLYYATLLVHFPVEEWLAARRNLPRSGQIPDLSPQRGPKRTLIRSLSSMSTRPSISFGPN